MTDNIDYAKITQNVYLELNKVRSDPKSLIPHLNKIKTYFDGLEYKDPKLGGTITTNEGVGAIDDLIQFLERQKEIHKLEKNSNIERACKKLSSFVGPRGITGKQDGEYSLKNRVEKCFGYSGVLGQNICYGSETAIDILVQMLVDDGLKSRNHRKNCFSLNFGMFGVSCEMHKDYGTVCVIDFFGDDDNEDGIQYVNRKTLIRDEEMDYEKLNEEVCEEVNKVRADPSSYINHLKKMKEDFDGNDYKDVERNLIIETEEGISGINEAIFYLENQESLKKLEKSEALDKTSRVMLSHIGPKGSVKHEKGELSLKSRIDKHVNKSGLMGENLSFGNNKAVSIICQIIIDDGVKSRGHRKNLFDERYNMFGTSCGYHKVYGTAAVFNFMGPNTNNNDNLDKYEIDRNEWPETAMQVEQHCRVETLHDRKRVFLVYDFTLENGDKVQQKKEIEEMIH